MKTGSRKFNMAVAAKREHLFQHVGNIRNKIKRPSPSSAISNQTELLRTRYSQRDIDIAL